MGKTTQRAFSVYLPPEIAAKFEDLAASTRIPKAELLREAVTDLLSKHKVLKPPKRRP
jgi:predicted DNA-binding protein